MKSSAPTSLLVPGFWLPAFAATVLLAGIYAPNPVAAASFESTPIENALEYSTVGCGGAVVQTPQPGTQFSDPLFTLPASATSFYAKAASLNVTWLSALDCTHTHVTHRLIPAALDTPMPADENSVYSSTSWSGYEINNTAQFVQSGWTIPTVVNPPVGHRYSTTGYDSSTWAGIGGGFPVNPVPLIQSGSTQKLSATNVATYYFWYEIVGGPSDTGGEIMIGSPPAAPGDDVGGVSIWLQSSMKAEMGICNFTHASCVQFYVAGTPQPGGTVEWIVEAPKLGGVIQPLADFGLVNFYNACWATTYTPGSPISCNPISVPGLTVPASISLTRRVFGCGQTLATPQGLTSTSSFTDIYQLADTCQ